MYTLEINVVATPPPDPITGYRPSDHFMGFMQTVGTDKLLLTVFDTSIRRLWFSKEEAEKVKAAFYILYEEVDVQMHCALGHCLLFIERGKDFKCFIDTSALPEIIEWLQGDDEETVKSVTEFMMNLVSKEETIE